MDLKKAHSSLEELKKLRDIAKDRSEVVNFMQFLSHVDIRRLCFLFESAEKATQDLVDLNASLVSGISATVALAENGGKRDAVLASLKSILKDNGY